MTYPDLPALNLPPLDVRLAAGPDGQPAIYDAQRSRYVALTPEEWVRQNFVGWLTGELGYPRSMVVNELGLRLNGRQRRADTLVYDRSLRPLMVVEYKRPSVAVTQRVFDQVVRYNIVFRAPYIAVSNGLHHYCCRIHSSGGGYEFLSRFPDYETLINTSAI